MSVDSRIRLGLVLSRLFYIIVSYSIWSFGKRETVGTSGGGKGRRRGGGIRPGRHCAGAAFGGAKIWNSEIWPFLANWRLHCRTDSAYSVIYITLFHHRHVQEV